LPNYLDGTCCDLTGTGHCVAFNSPKTARAGRSCTTRCWRHPAFVRPNSRSLLVSLNPNRFRIGKLLVEPSTLTREVCTSCGLQGLLTISERLTMRQRFVALTREGARSLQRSMSLLRKVQTRFVSEIGEQRLEASATGTRAAFDHRCGELERRGRAWENLID
jgi:hypothetical protein